MKRIIPDVVKDFWRGELRTFAEFREASALYHDVFRYGASDLSLNSNLLSALANNGGSVVGVKDAGRLIGFAYGFPGTDGQSLYHYSQAAVVSQAYQGKGVGRVLKEQQRVVALANGMTRMRWTFDPVLARNGHFNFNTLGAMGIDFVADYYGREHTDRIVVEWQLTVPTCEHHEDLGALKRARPSLSINRADWGILVGTQTSPSWEEAWLPVLGGVVSGDEETPELVVVRDRIRDSLRRLRTDALVLIGCIRFDRYTSVYHAVSPAMLASYVSAVKQPVQGV